MVFCRVESWLTGRRLVSLPFSDFCEPLVPKPEHLDILLNALERELRTGSWRYIEVRPFEMLETTHPLFHTSGIYYRHEIDLEPSLETLFRKFHKDSIQRKIRRAEREGLTYQEGSSESLLNHFYPLIAVTRRRHGVPPQPKSWFHNLMDCFGDALKIRIAFKDTYPIAGMLTIRHKDTMVYKHGGSDARFSPMGGIHMLYWRSIQDAKNSGLRIFDLGRSDADQQGLVTFKTRWGARQSRLFYSRCTLTGNSDHIFESNGSNWRARMARKAFQHSPLQLLSLCGGLLYKHVG